MQRNHLNRLVEIFNWSALVMVAITMLLIFFWAPTERTMGDVQRIFYFHVGSGWVSMVAFLIALVGGVLYLRRPSPLWDTVALASVEIGLAFATMNIASGSIWGRPAWNTWWIWSPRLTSVTVMWLVYVAYFMLRGAIEDEQKRRRFSAVYVIAGFVTVLMTFFSIRFLRDIHPVLIGESSEAAQGLQEFESGLESARMGITLTVTTLTFSLLYVAWLFNRIRLQRMIEEVEQLKMRVFNHLQRS